MLKLANDWFISKKNIFAAFEYELRYSHFRSFQNSFSYQNKYVECMIVTEDLNLEEQMEATALGKPQFKWVPRQKCCDIRRMHWIHDKKCWCVMLSLATALGVLLYLLFPLFYLV